MYVGFNFVLLLIFILILFSIYSFLAQRRKCRDSGIRTASRVAVGAGQGRRLRLAPAPVGPQSRRGPAQRRSCAGDGQS
jgi:hypothetical protein